MKRAVPRLRTAGFIIALIPIPFLFIYSITNGLNEYYSFANNLLVAFMYSVPCLLITAVCWRWPRRGGAAAILAALLLLVLSITTIMQSKAPDPVSHRVSLSFTEISTHIVLYAMLLIGCTMAFASAWKSGERDFHPGTPDIFSKSRLTKTGLLMMLMPGVISFLGLSTVISITGDMVPSGNIFSGLLMGLMYSSPSLILAAAAWWWPRRGSAVAIALSAVAMLLYGLLLVVFAEYPAIPFLTTAYFALMTVVLAGSILVFISVRKTGQALKDVE